MPPRRYQRGNNRHIAGGGLDVAAIGRGDSQRRVAAVFFRIHTRPQRKQCGDNGDMAISGGVVQRRQAVVAFRIHTRPQRKQCGDNGDMAISGGVVQRRFARAGCRIHIRHVRGNQVTDRNQAARSGGGVQGVLVVAMPRRGLPVRPVIRRGTITQVRHRASNRRRLASRGRHTGRGKAPPD